MTDSERIQFLTILQQYRRKFAKDKAASKRFLVKAGILTRKGNLTSPYKNLCIAQGLV